MCPYQTGDNLNTEPGNMVAVPIKNSVQKRGTSSVNRQQLEQQRQNPYAARASDFLSNISNFNIIESTLRGLLTIIGSVVTGFILSVAFFF
jgi:homocitrate synthase